MTFSVDNPEGGCNNPPLGKYVREKPSGEQGLRGVEWVHCLFLFPLVLEKMWLSHANLVFFV